MVSVGPVRVGHVPPGVGGASRYVTVRHGDDRVLRIDVYPSAGADTYAFEEAIRWNDQHRPSSACAQLQDQRRSTTPPEMIFGEQNAVTDSLKSARHFAHQPV